MQPSKLAQLSDDDLLAKLSELVQQRQKLTSKILVHLGEVDARKLYRQQACSSMFVYCRDRLHMAEARAFRHIRAARAARQFPLILGHIDDGAIHLTALSELVPHLTDANHVRLLDEARFRTTDQVKLLIAQEKPKADVPTMLRKLPQRPASASPHSVTLDQKLALTTHKKPSPKPQPLSAARYKLTVTLGEDSVGKLKQAKDLLRHRNPGVDTEGVLDLALGELVNKLEKRKFAETAQPRPCRPTSRRHRAIPHATKRSVARRDSKQCAFIDKEGRRCQATAFLEFHHRHAFAKGGQHSTSNIELRCRAHNMMAAELDFGRAHMEKCLNSH